MPKIRHLTIPYITDNEVLSTISRKCAHLVSLDISGSSDITQENILLLSSLRSTLQVLNLAIRSDDILSPSTVAELINRLPKLVSIGGYQKTGHAIEILFNEMQRSHPTKLRYLHDKQTKFESISAIHNLCPGKYTN